MASAQQIPKGRGFDHSLVYFEGAEDHWTQRSCVDPMCLMPVNDSTPLPPRTGFVNLTQSPYDLWRDDAPAADLAGSGYSGYMFNDFAIGVIEAHNVAKPLFLYLAPANSHSPLEAPQRFIELYPDDWYLDRRMYAAMCSFWDEVVGNVTAALRAKSMWESTLFVFSSDKCVPPALHPAPSGLLSHCVLACWLLAAGRPAASLLGCWPATVCSLAHCAHPVMHD
jgi:arylsulfatase A-like enzyme